MILEAQQIYESLSEANWDLDITHPDLKRPGKAHAVLVDLEPDGKAVTGLRFINPQFTPNYWSQANGNHNNFPATKIKGPLSHELDKAELETYSKERDSSKRTAVLSRWLESHFPTKAPSPFTPGLRSKLKDRYDQLSELKGGLASTYLDLLNLCSRLTDEEGQTLMLSFLEALQKSALHGPADEQPIAQGLVIKLLFFPKAKSDIPVIWNIPNSDLNGRDSSSPKNFALISSALLELESKHTETSASITCSLTGRQGLAVGDKFPQLTFPAVGKTYIFARNKQTAALARYGTNGTDSYVVGNDHANSLAAALTALTLPEREGKTWMKVSSDQPKKSDLMLVFQAGSEDLDFAAAIGDEQLLIGESKFQEFTSRLLERVKGKTTDQLRGRLMMTVFSAVDPGNRKVILHRELAPDALDESASLWTNACKSFPGRALPIPQKKGEKALTVNQLVISPGTIPALTRRLYFADGRSSPDTPGGFSFNESFDLLVNLTRPNMVDRRLLGVAYRRLGKLLSSLASTTYRHPNKISKMPAAQKWTCLRAQSLFSILLVSMERPYEKVMNSLPYQLGQLCAAFDVLHASYCHIERGGNLPPKLIGNSCFQAASRNPLGALKQLCQRIAPHKAWFDRFKGDLKEKGLAKLPEKSASRSTVLHALKLRRYFSDAAPAVASALHSAPLRTDDLFCSELLLGYLAGPADEKI